MLTIDVTIGGDTLDGLVDVDAYRSAQVKAWLDELCDALTEELTQVFPDAMVDVAWRPGTEYGRGATVIVTSGDEFDLPAAALGTVEDALESVSLRFADSGPSYEVSTYSYC